MKTMATTLTLAVLSPAEPIEVAHVGDSRAYLTNGRSAVSLCPTLPTGFCDPRCSTSSMP